MVDLMIMVIMVMVVMVVRWTDGNDYGDGRGEDDQPTSDGEPPPLFRVRQDQTGGAGSVGG